MAIDSRGRIFIGDKKENDIKVFSMTGMYLFSLQKAPTLKKAKPSFVPRNMVVRPDGSLAVLSAKDRKLQEPPERSTTRCEQLSCLQRHRRKRRGQYDAPHKCRNKNPRNR